MSDSPTPMSGPGSRTSSDVGAALESRTSHSQEHVIERDDGAKVFVEVHGPEDAPGLLILDGIGCSGWAFRRIIPELSSKHRVALMHYRGHGRSPEPPEPWHIGMHDLADDAAAVLEHLGMERSVIVGFSMGFQVAVELYKRHRDLVGGLVSLAGPSGRALAHFQGTGVYEQLLPLLRFTTRHAGDLTSKVWKKLLPSKWLPLIGLHTQLNAIRIEIGDLQFYLKQMAEMNPQLFVEMLHEAARHAPNEVLPQVRVPTLVIAGAQDRFVPLETIRRVAFSIPGASWVVIREASHALPAEFHDELTERLEQFMQSVHAKSRAFPTSA